MHRTWNAFVLCAVVAVVGACGGTASESGGGVSNVAPVAVPEFTLEDQTGLPFGLHDLHGKVWVANAMATRETASTPAVTDLMAALVKDIAGNTALADVE